TPESCYLACSGSQRVAHAAQLSLHRSVEYLVAYDHAHTANEVGVYGEGRLELETELLLKPGNEFLDLCVGKSEGAGNLGQRITLLLVLQHLELLGNLGQSQYALVIDQQLNEISRGVGQRGLDEAREQLKPL